MTNEHLTEIHSNKFETVGRGGIPVKGKGIMYTYWLLGKQGFPYRVDLDETTRLAEATTYWRLDNTNAGDGH